MNCAHCNARNAHIRWYLRACADGPKRYKKLCKACDVVLNRVVLEFFNDPGAVEKMTLYSQTRMPAPRLNRADTPGETIMAKGNKGRGSGNRPPVTPKK